MTQFTFNLFGKFEISVDAAPVTDFHSDKARALLAYLVLEPNKHMRQELAALLWPEIGDQYARANLRNTLHRLRQTLDRASAGAADHLLSVTRQAVWFNTNSAFVDVHRFQSLLDSESAQHGHKSTLRPQTLSSEPSSTRLEQLAEAVALYQGELLAGFSVAEAPGFEEWLLLCREMTQQQALLAFHTLTTEYETLGDYERAHNIASRLLTLDPYREETYRQIMRLLAQTDQPDQALQYLEQMRQRMHEELGVEPSEQTLALARQIAVGDFDKRTSLRLLQQDDRMNRNALHPFLPSSDPPFMAPLDLDNIPNPEPFFGRQQERQKIAEWLLRDRCRLVMIFGMGGMGKTSLAARCVREIVHRANGAHFDAILWRSLVNAPPLTQLLSPLLQILSDQQLLLVPKNVDEQLRLLLGYLRNKRVLLVLDNMESILDGERAGAYLPGYESYNQLIQQIATLEHQSHLILTSREQLRDFKRLEGDNQLVQSLQLDGLDDRAGHELLAQRGLQGMDDEEMILIKRYSGNPLALKLVADSVEDIFGRDIIEFLTEESLVFDDIRDVLDQQFARLSPLERELLFWLAVERELTSAQLLRKNLLHRPAQSTFMEALRSLLRRSLIERHDDGFTLQNVVTEYLTDRLIEALAWEIETGEIDFLHRHALLKAEAKESVRESQARMLLMPIGKRLLTKASRATLILKLQELLTQLRIRFPNRPSYAGGNILNLLLQSSINVAGFDFSQLSIRQAYLREAALLAVNFSDAEFADVAFAGTFGDIHALALSPNGQLLAAATETGEVFLWSTADAQLITILHHHTELVLSVAFSPDGTILASSGGDHIVCLWDVESRQLHAILRGPTNAIRCLAFSPDGRLLASVSDDRKLFLWEIPSGQLRAILTKNRSNSMRTLTFSPDGRLLASGGVDQIVLLWDLSNGQVLQTLRGHKDWVRSLAFSLDGKTLVSGSNDGTIRFWNIANGELEHTIEVHEGWIQSIAFSPDGKILASGGDDETVRLWDAHNRKLQYTLRGHTGWVNAVAFSPDGKILASGGDDRTLYLWDVTRKQASHRLQGYTLTIESVAISPDGMMLASGSSDQAVRFWRIAGYDGSNSVRASIEGRPIHVGRVRVVAFSPDNKMLACGGANQTIQLLDVDSRQVCVILHGHTSWIWSLAFSPDGETLASCSADETVRLWSVHDGQLLQTLEGHSGWVNSVVFSPDGETLASGAADETVRLWDVQSGKLRYVVEGHSGWVNSVVFSPDGRLLASGAADQSIRLWDVDKRQLLQTLEGHNGWVLAVAFTTDGATLISCGLDQTVRIWNLPSGQLRHTLKGHTQRVTGIAINSRERILVSCSADETIRLWQIDSDACLQVLEIPGPYDGMNITGVTGISEAQRVALKALGAVEDERVAG
ncbi:AAA family ATPase [Chloroflexi bacterium TSY]|nr:AAA family ATPase [Chloroflexi bacterium TSY]